MRYGFEWTAGPVLLGRRSLLLLVPGFALIAVIVVALAAIAALVALAGAILASPYLLVRTLRRRLAERHQSTAAVPIASVIHSGVRSLPQNRRHQGAHSRHPDRTRRERHTADRPRARRAHRTMEDLNAPYEARAVLEVAHSFADELSTLDPEFDRLQFIKDATDDPS